MTKELILAWQNSQNHRWIAIGRLSYDNAKDTYKFCYTQAANSAYKKGQFSPLWGMDDTTLTYESQGEPLPIFKNRLLTKSRPEYKKYLQWLGISDEKLSPIDELALSGGIRATDDYQLFPVPTNENGKYCLKFFAHGIRHLPSNYIERVKRLKQGDRLYLMADYQNEIDPNAITLRTEDPPELAGYVPSFFTNDISKLLKQNGSTNVIVSVVQVNLNAPSQFRLQCELETEWKNGFKALSDELIQPAT